MDIKRCFELNCEFEGEYVCKCASPWTYSCKKHTWKHIELSNKTHTFEFIFIDPCEGAKETILGFLTREKSEYINLKRKILASFSQNLLNSEEYIKEIIKTLDSSSDIISNCCLKIEEAKIISDSMQDPILDLLRLQPNEAVEKVKMMIPTISAWYESTKSFCGFNKEIGNIIDSFIKDEFEAHLDKSLVNIETTEEDKSKATILTNSKLASIKDSISIINESNQSLKEFENVKESRKINTENKKNLLNFQISSTTHNLHKESALNALETLRNKTAEIWSRPNNPELELDFRTTCSVYQSSSNLYDPQLIQAYQDYLNAYQQKTSLYNIWKDKYDRTHLLIYNIENKTQEVKILKTLKPLNHCTCIAQLPNGKLFCFGGDKYYTPSGITELIDMDGGDEVLPSGAPCNPSSCIYFNNSVYYFGGNYWNNCLNLSGRFDLEQNRWFQLTSMPKVGWYCYIYSIIFNGNILISGYWNRNLWLYSIDIDSFSTIPYQFAEKKIKVLINAERLYLIECGADGSIYESEIGSDTNWTRIADSTLNFNPYQVYCSYNKGGIYIGTIYKDDYYCGGC